MFTVTLHSNGPGEVRVENAAGTCFLGLPWGLLKFIEAWDQFKHLQIPENFYSYEGIKLLNNESQ
jgi:hypothetical protein